ncbi:endonuclease/exonuclease/phosphatase family protein [Aerosticca soli]|nr:endonuclease/exonuclease/phosphatase family protein [Aerosticca soli]
MAALAPVARACEALRVMSFNVRVPVASDGPNRWEARRELFVRTIATARPDLLGTQELHQQQADAILARLPAYAWFGLDRRGGHTDEHMGLFYRGERLRVLDSGNFWLSDTPDVPGSISWGHPYPRMVTWGLFEDRACGRRFYAFNTHLPYRDEDEAARVKGAQAILARLAALPPDVPVVLTGDLNAEPDSPTYAHLAGNLRDARAIASRVEGPEKTFHDFTGVPNRRIDYIFVRGFRVDRYATLTGHEGARYPSDHFPVMAELRWP